MKLVSSICLSDLPLKDCLSLKLKGNEKFFKCLGSSGYHSALAIFNSGFTKCKKSYVMCQTKEKIEEDL